MVFGLTATGFNRKRLSDILLSLQASSQAAFPGIGVSPDQAMGVLLGVISDPLDELWQLLEAVYISQYRQGAEGVSLDGVAQFVGLIRLPPTPSTVRIGLIGTEGTLVAEGKQVQGVNSGPVFATDSGTVITASAAIHIEMTAADASGSGVVYGCIVSGIDFSQTTTGAESGATMAETLRAAIAGANIPNLVVSRNNAILILKAIDGATPFSSSSSGSLSTTLISSPALCSAVDSGPLNIPTGTITVIVTPVIGWAAVENLVAGLSGRDLENDIQLRQRILVAPVTGGRASELAMKARILNEVPGVTQVNVISNRSMTTDGAGRPPKSVEVVIQSAGDDDDIIAQKIYDNIAGGIESCSTADPPSSGTAIDPDGNSVTVLFSRQSNINVWVWADIQLNTKEKFPSDGLAQIAAAILAVGNESVIGDDIIVQKYVGAAMSIPGVATVAIYISISGDTKPDSPSSNISLSSNQLAVFDSSRITAEIAS